MAARMLLVGHSNSGRTQQVIDALLVGARDPEIGDVEVRDVPALEATADDFRWATGVLLATPAHFGYMSGALKHCFDTVYEPLLDDTRGLPYALVVKGRSEPAGVYEVLDYHTPESFPNFMEAMNHYKEGVAQYRVGNWDKGIKAFRESQALNPNDQLLEIYIARCEYLKASPPEGAWNGIWVMTSK